LSLNAALVDRARIVGKRAVGERVEGETIYSEVTGPWFRARLEMRAYPDTPNPVVGTRDIIKTPTLMYGLRDSDGNEIVLNAEDRVEVASNELGGLIYDVAGDPSPIRKKRRLLGHEATLRKVVIHRQERP
jgi:hypothetical protein